MKPRSLSVLALLTAAILLWGCGGGGYAQSGSTNVTVSVGSVASAAAARQRAATIPSEVASLRLTVSSTATPADMTPIVDTLSVTPSVTTYELSVTVPNGSRLFLLEAFDNTSTLRYRGDATMVLTGGTASLTIQMYSDVTPPSILSVSPVSGATDVALSSPVTVTFSEAMDNTTVTGATFTVTAGGTPVPGTVGYSGTTATFTPTGNWNYSTSYAATVTTGAEDLAGNAIVSDYAWGFTTVAPAGTVSTPGFSPAPGTYASAQSVTLSTSTSGATIRYTTDGSTPTTTTGTVYTVPIAVSSTTTIRAIAYQTGWTSSSVASAAYTITGTVATPAVSPAAGTYATAQSVTLSTSTSGATIRYTTDGSTPTSTTGTVYAGAIAVSATTTINAIAYLAGWADSSVASGTYTITVTFSQTDLAGTWDYIFFDIGRRVGWARGTATFNSSGGLTAASGLESNGSTAVPAPGSILWTISSSGVVSESGSGGNAAFHGQMSSNKQLVIGTEDWAGTDNTVTLRVFRKRTGTPFSNADLANKTFTFHGLRSGTDNTWSYGAGSTDGSGLVAITSEVGPTGPRTPGPAATLSVNSVGIVTISDDNTWYGLMTDDKKVIFSITTMDSGSYGFNVITITGQTYTQSDYAGIRNFSTIRNTVPNPGWAYGVASIDAAGNGTYLSYTDSGGVQHQRASPGYFPRAV